MHTKLLVSFVLSTVCFSTVFGSTQPMRAADAKSIVAEIKDNKAKLKVVNLWASWCAPCRKELPIFAKIENEFKEVQFFYISGDDDKDAAEALKFIESTGVGGTKLRLSPTSEEAFHEFAPNWSGSLPFTIIYDSDHVSDLIGNAVTESLLRNTIKFRLAHPSLKALHKSLPANKMNDSQGKK